MGNHMQDIEVVSAPRENALPKRIATALASVLVVVGTFAALSGSWGPADPTQNVATSDLATIAGFKVKMRYKCIDRWKRCTDFWCDANCNHVPKYCPASYCRGSPVPTPAPRPPPPNPTPAPTPAPTCAMTKPPVYTECHSICTSGTQKNPDGTFKLSKAERQRQTKGKNKGQVTTDQCVNCYCSACKSEQFKNVCGGIHPTEASCSVPSCCPSGPGGCLGGVNQIRTKMCNSCKCAGCNPAFFGNNCGSKPDFAQCKK